MSDGDMAVCECGRPIRAQKDNTPYGWTHLDDDPACDSGYLDDDGDWHDPNFASPVDGWQTLAAMEEKRS